MGDNRSKGLQQNAVLSSVAAGKVSDLEPRSLDEQVKPIFLSPIRFPLASVTTKPRQSSPHWSPNSLDFISNRPMGWHSRGPLVRVEGNIAIHPSSFLVEAAP